MRAGGPVPSVPWLFFSPFGRAGRQTYILSWLFWVCADGFVATRLVASHDEGVGFVLWFLVFLIAAVSSTVSLVMLTVKRLHDMGFPGPLTLLLFIPAISFVALAAFCIWPSQPTANAYGPMPDWRRE